MYTEYLLLQPFYHNYKINLNVTSVHSVILNNTMQYWNTVLYLN